MECDLFTAIHMFGNSPDVSAKCVYPPDWIADPETVCPLVLELRADLRFVTVFFMIGILVNVFCVSTRFRVHIPDCVREVVSENHFFLNINFVTFPD